MYLGVNLTVGDWPSGTWQHDALGYKFPSHDDIDYFAAKGFSQIRLPFSWERLQPVLGGALDSTYLGHIRDIVDYAASKGITVDLDLHNFGTYNNDLIGSPQVPVSAFADVWGRIAGAFAGSSNVTFGLMNEPQLHTASDWLTAANAAIGAIRGAGATQEIMVSGTYWDGGSNWTTSDNAAVLGAPGAIADPLHNYAFEVHQYLDDGSGQNEWVVSPTVGSERLEAVTDWARQTGNKLYLGEFGVANNPTSLAGLDDMLAFLQKNGDVWQAASYWVGGVIAPDYIYSVEPELGLLDRAQMDVLERYVGAQYVSRALGDGRTEIDTVLPGHAAASIVDVTGADGRLQSRDLFNDAGARTQGIVANADGGWTVTSYDASYASGATSATRYDGNQQRVALTTWNADGSRQDSTFAPGDGNAATQSSYDAQGRPTFTIVHDANGHSDWQYANGVLTMTEHYNVNWALDERRQYDAAGHVTSDLRVAADGSITVDQYNAAGLITLTQGFNAGWGLTSVGNYDAAGHMTLLTRYPSDGGREVSSFQADGVTLREVDLYDAAGRTVSRTHLNLSGAITSVDHFDAAGALTVTMVAGNGSTLVLPTFGTGDQIVISNSSLDVSHVTLQIGSLDIRLDTDGDGVPDSTITIEDPVQNSEVIVTPGANGTTISLSPLAPATAGDDVITGTGGLDYITGGAGNDVLSGLDGADALSGGDGADQLYGGADTDTLRGGAGDDLLDGGDGDDKLYGGLGVDHLVGGAGNDELWGDDGAGPTEVAADLLEGGDGDDILHASSGATLTGGAGSDRFALDAAGLSGVTITDFTAGRGGDVLDVTGLLATATGLPAGGDAVALGYLRFVADGDNTLVEFDANGGGDDFRVVATIQHMSPARITADNLAGVALPGVTLGPDAGGRLTGSSGDDHLTGGDGGAMFDLSAGGHDVATGGAGNDAFYLGAALDAADRIDGGAGGNDQLGLQGDYAGDHAYTFGADNLHGIEQLVLLSGGDTRFGGAGTDRFSYDLTTLDANVAAGQQLVVQLNALQPGENVTFDGSAETDGSFLFYGGQGDDHLTGGAQSDGFFFGDGRFGAGDVLVGGGGANNQLGLRGDYSLAFGADQLQGVQQLVVLSGSDTRFGGTTDTFHYNLTLADGNVRDGLSVVQGNALGAAETLRVDAHLVTSGPLTFYAGAGSDVLIGGAGDDLLFGGLGADHLEGGGGADRFVYRSAAESGADAFDTIADFDFSADKLDVPGSASDYFRCPDVSVSGMPATGVGDALTRALDGVLSAHGVSLVTASDGALAGHVFAVIDQDGVAGFSAANDIVVDLGANAHPPATGVEFLV